jgi:chromosome segregation ATPase
MNTPTPTPRTDAATYPADCLGTTLVTNRDCARALETELVTLTGAYTCTHHNDAERTACPVCLVAALTAERDQLRGALALGQENCDAVYDELRADCDELRGDVVRIATERDQLRAKAERFQRLQRFIDTAAAEMKVGLITFGGIAELRAERDQLRSDCENETKWAAHYLADAIASKARAERAEAELAKEREKVRVLREALENLRDEQNGAPLCTREEQWTQAMDRADAALAATEVAK